MSSDNDGREGPDKDDAPRTTIGPDGVEYKHRVTRMLGRAAGKRSTKSRSLDDETPTTNHVTTVSNTQNDVVSKNQFVDRKEAVARIEMLSRHLVEEPARRTPVLTSCDVLVVGGGPAGLSAAIGASRCGTFFTNIMSITHE